MTFPCRDARADANAGAVRIDGDQLGSRRVAVAGADRRAVCGWVCGCVCVCESISVSFALSPLREGGCCWLASSQAVRAGRLVGWLGWAACMGKLAAWAAWLAGFVFRPRRLIVKCNKASVRSDSTVATRAHRQRKNGYMVCIGVPRHADQICYRGYPC
jgi:hypothetical protein